MLIEYQLNEGSWIGKASVHWIFVIFQLSGAIKMMTRMMHEKDYQVKINYILLNCNEVEPYIK